jgi:hypothetical protein
MVRHCALDGDLSITLCYEGAQYEGARCTVHAMAKTIYIYYKVNHFQYEGARFDGPLPHGAEHAMAEALMRAATTTTAMAAATTYSC